MRYLIAPGFWSNAPVHAALAAGSVVAVVCAVVGCIAVLRASVFSAHALSDVAATGGALASMLALPLLGGFVAGSIGGSVALEQVESVGRDDRDVVSGIVLGAASGLAALLFYLASQTNRASGATERVLFGSLFTVSGSTLWVVLMTSCVLLAALASLSRPLTLASLNAHLAEARGVQLGAIRWAFAIILAVSVALAALVVGAVIAGALMFGPAAAAMRVTRRLRDAVVVSVGLSLSAVGMGVLLSYDSYEWTSSHRTAPVSLCVVAVIAVQYVTSRLIAARRDQVA